MDANTVTQMVTVVLAVLAIIWHQQRSIDKLRADFERAVDKLRDRLDSVERRLARIEGFLGIGMPANAASGAPGAELPRKPPESPEPD